MSQSSTEISGTIESVVYKNSETGYAVLEVCDKSGASYTVVGCVPEPGEGEVITAEGGFVVHPTYGTQFKAEKIDRRLPDEAPAVLKYLSSGVIKGIGLTTAHRIVDRFGGEALAVISACPQRLTEVKGISPAKAKQIGEQFSAKNSLRTLISFLGSNNLDPRLAIPLYKTYGENAANALKKDPYILIDEPYGVDFGSADGFAGRLGFAKGSPERARAAVKYELVYNSQEGHVFLPRGELIRAACELSGESAELAEDALSELTRSGELRSEDISGLGAVYLRGLYEDEVFTAQRIAFLASLDFSRAGAAREAERQVAKIEAEQGISYAVKQRQAIISAASNGVMILTGGPGTGKTTTVRGMLAVFDAMGSKTLLAAPTGRAAKRLSELCGREAKTIHRLLEVGFGAGGQIFLRNSENPIEADVIIVDELSMVDINLAAALLAAVKNGTRLILVGDADQLPPVGPGCVLRDLLRSGLIPSVHLTEIFRQARESAIVVNAHAVNRGEMPELRAKTGNFFFLRRETPGITAETIVDLCVNRLPGRMGIEPAQIQVLSPTKRGEAGVESLNIRLQQAINPSAENKRERKTLKYILREGDRVMQTVNNYELMWHKEDGSETGQGVFNGDVGVITRISPAAQLLSVLYEDRVADYAFEQLEELELAYAMTVHKAQGSEFRAVILAACMRSSRLLCRNLFYTAITRARELMIIVGREDSVAAMVENGSQHRRFSGLRARLSKLCGGSQAGGGV